MRKTHTLLSAALIGGTLALGGFAAPSLMEAAAAKATKEAEKAGYTCPMHPAVNASKPGDCPDCGMHLQKTAAKKATKAAYTCPMHPEQAAATPGKCDECGMHLKKTSK